MTHPEEDEPGAAPPHEPGEPTEGDAAWHGFAHGAPPAEPGDALPTDAAVPNVAREPETAARAAPPPVGSTGGAPWLSLLLFAVLAAGLFWVWGHPRGAAADPQEVAALQRELEATKQSVAQLQSQTQPDSGLAQQVQTLSARVDQLEKQAQAQPEGSASNAAPAGNADDLARRLDDVTGRVAALESRPAPAASESAPATDSGPLPAAPPQAEPGQTAAISQLAARVSRLEHGAGKVESLAERAARITQAQAALAALDAGKPLGTLQGAPPEVARFATESPPTLAALRAQFPAVAERIRAAMEPGGPDQTFFGRALARLERGITVREGDRVVVGAPQEAMLERAEDDVRIDDMTASVNELGKLTGHAREAAAPWIRQVQAVLAARAALAQMAARG